MGRYLTPCFASFVLSMSNIKTRIFGLTLDFSLGGRSLHFLGPDLAMGFRKLAVSQPL